MCAATTSTVARAFGDVLLGARRRRNLEPAIVAARAGIDVADLTAIENGDVEPTLSLFIRSAVGIGVPPEWLLEEVLAWLSRGDAACNPDGSDAEGRRTRMRAVGSALTAVLLGSSEKEIASTHALGERLVAELSKQGLAVSSFARCVFTDHLQ